MNAATRTKRQIVKARRSGLAKRCLSAYVAKAVKAEADRKAVTNALREKAKKLREAGQLGKVQTRICHVAAGVVGPKYRYTAAQVAQILAVYNPRKAAYKDAKAALIG